MMKDLFEFLVQSNSRVSCGDMWMCLTKDKEVFDKDEITYTVYQKSYGQRKTRILYEGQYLSTALEFLKGDVS